MEGKSDEAFKLVPLQQKHCLQITVPDELTITFVTSVIPANNLARLSSLEVDVDIQFWPSHLVTVRKQRAFAALL